ncbi:MAG TPA: CTP synthetase [Roseovarius sp.]|nr:CTP synthetase [Roseovarius sp.]
MLWLMTILHLFIGSTLAGVGIVVLLVMGQGGAWALGGAVLAGFVLAFPVAWLVAHAIHDEN